MMVRRVMQMEVAGAMLAVILAGCSAPADSAAAAGASATATASASATAQDKAGAVAFEDNAEKDGGTREFAYKWPAAASAVPVLAQRFTAERDKALVEQKADWDSALAEFAGEDCAGCKSLAFAKEWKVVADLPRYLSLSADIYLYTGGAHGNSGFDALVWDREAGAALDPETMFRSEAALQEALGAGWCKALKAERQKRMGADFTDDGFFPCPGISELTLLPGSSDKQRFNRIGLIAAPYVAGSYAEGPYEVTLPVTQAVLAAVKPEYKAAFALAK
jgi:Deacetylase PdaC